MPRLVAGKLLPWRRFWVPRDKSIRVGSEGRGFLEDPEDEWGRAWNPDVRPLDELLTAPCLILSGQPGIGKTIEVQELIARRQQWVSVGEQLIHFHCRHLDSVETLRRETVDSPQWKSALAADQSVRLLMDGVDEALQRVAVLVPALTRFLRDAPLDRVQVILVCRAAEWDDAEGAELFSLWPEPNLEGVFELCPLRWKDAELAARESNVDPDKFWKALIRHQVQGLAARPVTLRMLLEEMQSGGDLPTSHHELFERALRRLSAEVDETRTRYMPTPRPADVQVARVAARIAALLALGGRSVVSRGEEPLRPNELHVNQIGGVTETVDGITFEVTDQVIAATLDTPLFSFRGSQRYGFDHPTFAEHLAASYLRHCGVTQLRRMLCVSLEGQEWIAPQLAEVAARLAAMNPLWRDYLIDTEPEIILRTDSSPLDTSSKARFVDRLLHRAEHGEAFDVVGTGHFYHTLHHPGLADQLRPYLHDENYNQVVRRMAFEIAGDAQVTELEPELWQRIAEGDSCFNSICHALGDLAGRHSHDQLMGALRGDRKDNAVYDLRALALRKLVPGVLTVREVLPYLRPQPRDRIYGLYDMTLRYELPRHVSLRDLPALFDVMQAHQGCFDSLHWLSHVVSRAVQIALENIDSPGIAEGLAKVWRSKVRAYAPLPSRSNHRDPDPLAALEDPAVRRTLIRRILTLPESDANDLGERETPMLRMEDTSWLLNELPSVPIEHRTTWAKVCAGKLWSGPRSDYRDLLLLRHAEVEELRSVLPKPQRYDIVTTLDRLMRAGELRRQRIAARNARRWRRYTRSELLDLLRESIAADNETSWVRFCHCAYESDPSDPKQGDRHPDRTDITDSLGWRDLSESERSRIRSFARRFLLSFRDGSRKPHHWSNYAEAACHAMWLLRDDISSDSELSTAIIERWRHVVFDRLYHGTEAEHLLVATIYHLTPDTAATRLSAKLHADNRRDGFIVHLEKFRSCWDERLASTVRTFLHSRGIKPQTLRRTFEFLAKHDRPAAITFFSELIAQRAGFSPLNRLGRALLAIALFVLTKEWWADASQIVTKAKVAVAQKVFLEAASDFLHRDVNFDEALTEQQLADAALLIRRLFPPTEYQDRHGPTGRVSARHHMPDLREGLIRSLVARGTTEACVSLRWIIPQVPTEEQVWLRWSYRETVANVLRRIWVNQTRTISQLLAMIGDSRAMTISIADDLLEALLASLERLQERLALAESPELRSLWNEPGRHSGKSPTPKSEEVLSNTVADWLQRDLGPASGVILNREVQATRLGRLDIKVEAVRRGTLPAAPVTVVIEVKGCWNRKVVSSIQTQLVNDYLVPNRWTHGIYLIGWFPTTMRSDRASRWCPSSHAQAQAEADQWALSQTPAGLHVRPLVLDCHL